MIAATAQLVVDRPERAIELYERALRIDRRPELYVGLGSALLQAGDHERATKAFTTAATFAPFTIEMIAEPSVRETVRRAVERRDRAIEAAAR
jgi:tetratricopeptide (TPR) repeat protein